MNTQPLPSGMIKSLAGRSPLFWTAAGIFLILLAGALDYVTGPEFSVSLFYLVPVAMVAWYASGKTGLVISVVATLVWISTDSQADVIYTHPIVIFWNSIMRFGFFAVVTVLLAELRKALLSLQNAARFDYLTGAVNVRYFYELAQMEIARAQRYKHPTTLVYIDLDNFKAINDQLGHSTGDLVLQAVASKMRRHIRKVDTIARLGGDEFALLMPETGEPQAREALARLWDGLTGEMAANQWPVTFSMGVVTFKHTAASVDEMVSLADERMYAIKTTSKNSICYMTYPE